jgi:hypothetical protein
MKVMLQYIKNLVIVISVLIFTSCEKEEVDYYAHPCADRSCDSVFFIDPAVQPHSYLDDNGYWHIEYRGVKYFTIKGKLDTLDDDYVINDIPLVEAAFDSNYWVAFNDMKFTIPVYSPFGLYNQQGNPIPVGNKTYDIGDIASQMEPLNIAGYQITKNTCFDCPYSDRLFATYSQYTYKPQQQMYLDNRMVGDTLEVYVKATFNTDGLEYLDNISVKEHTLKIIVNDKL